MHFMLLALVVFAVFYLKQDVDAETPDSIVVSNDKIEQFAARFALTKLRPPSTSELDAMIEDYIRDEVLYREALAMGLDQNDEQVRKRMRDKLEYLNADLAENKPTEEQLTHYQQQQRHEFLTDAEFSFQQVYINRDKHSDPKSQAEFILKQLTSGADPSLLGDASMLQAFFIESSSRVINNYFGDGFSDQLLKIKMNTWVGPIESSFGLHLVIVTQRVEGKLPDLVDIRQVVERSYKATKSEEQKEQAYQLMRGRYRIEIATKDVVE